MAKSLGFSVYLSTFEGQQQMLAPWKGTGAPVFLSLHISEEFGADYCRKAETACHWLAASGFRIIADVSVKTVAQFGEPDLVRLAKKLGIWALRIDYGFSTDEIMDLARQFPIVLNASTTDPESARRIAAEGVLVMAMHNFYPRPETALDSEFLLESTRSLQEAGLKVLGFIPGDETLRGPIYEGLPTLEAHRHGLPSAAFADLVLRYGMDDVFVGDPGISEMEQQRIRRFCDEGILSIPAELDESAQWLYDQVFTNRVDSPAWLVRFMESRTYSCFGATVEPSCCDPRPRGTITVDNIGYGRYSGEVQMLRQDHPADPRVNVIGKVCPQGLPLMDLIRRGAKFALVRP